MTLAPRIGSGSLSILDIPVPTPAGSRAHRPIPVDGRASRAPDGIGGRPHGLGGNGLRPRAAAVSEIDGSDAGAAAPASALDTTTLLQRAKCGDAWARDTLMRRYRPRLKRLAHGRLPSRARGPLETDDLVQDTMMRALAHLDEFDPRHPGAFLAYLRQVLLNRIRDEARRVGRRPGHDDLDDNIEDDGPSPLDQLMGRDARERYDRCLLRLPEEQQQAVFLRLELGLSYQEMAEVLRRPTANAARLATARALVRLAKEMGEPDSGR